MGENKRARVYACVHVRVITRCVTCLFSFVYKGEGVFDERVCVNACVCVCVCVCD